MKRIMEKVSILALSFILTTSFSISSAQSAMFAYYKGIPHSMIELLISLPSAGIMLSLIFNKWIGRLFSERQMIVTGLVAYSLDQSSLSGCLFISDYFWDGGRFAQCICHRYYQ